MLKSERFSALGCTFGRTSSMEYIGLVRPRPASGPVSVTCFVKYFFYEPRVTIFRNSCQLFFALNELLGRPAGLVGSLPYPALSATRAMLGVIFSPSIGTGMPRYLQSWVINSWSETFSATLGS